MYFVSLTKSSCPELFYKIVVSKVSRNSYKKQLECSHVSDKVGSLGVKLYKQKDSDTGASCTFCDILQTAIPKDTITLNNYLCLVLAVAVQKTFEN